MEQIDKALTSEQLDWDSRFFGYGVSRIDIQDADDRTVADEITRLQDRGSELIYVFSPRPLALDGFDAVLADRKLSYVLAEPHFRAVDRTVASVLRTSEALYELGCQAGGHSRYKVDPHISDEDFRRLFRLWIDNSVSRRFADHVLAYGQDGKELGMVTAGRKDDMLSIGLIATDASCRGTGIGSALIQSIINLAYESGLKVEVTTQADNAEACCFYETHGFKVESRTYVYHVWTSRNLNIQNHHDTI